MHLFSKQYSRDLMTEHRPAEWFSSLNSSLFVGVFRSSVAALLQWRVSVCTWFRSEIISVYDHELCYCPFLNELPCYVFSKLSKLEVLEELNLSGNKLKTIPSTVSSCKRLHTLITHSNHISVFPEVLSLPEIKVCDGSWQDMWNTAHKYWKDLKGQPESHQVTGTNECLKI